MINWYMEDKRFKPGTVADQGDIRIILKQPMKYVQGQGDTIVPDRWRLKISIRTYKENGVKDSLKRPVTVAEFKKCESLKEAQKRAEEWLRVFRGSMV